MSILKQPKTLAELQEEDEYLDTKVSVVRKRAMVKEVEKRMGKGGWKFFSSNGKKSGIDWSRIWTWLKK